MTNEISKGEASLNHIEQVYRSCAQRTLYQEITGLAATLDKLATEGKPVRSEFVVPVLLTLRNRLEVEIFYANENIQRGEPRAETRAYFVELLKQLNDDLLDEVARTS